MYFSIFVVVFKFNIHFIASFFILKFRNCEHSLNKQLENSSAYEVSDTLNFIRLNQQFAFELESLIFIVVE